MGSEDKYWSCTSCNNKPGTENELLEKIKELSLQIEQNRREKDKISRKLSDSLIENIILKGEIVLLKEKLEILQYPASVVSQIEKTMEPVQTKELLDENHQHKFSETKQSSDVIDENPVLYGEKSCVICPFTYFDVIEYKRHQKTVHGFKYMNYPCNQCDHIAPRLARLEIHMKKHKNQIKQNKSKHELKQNSEGFAGDLNLLLYEELQTNIEELKETPEEVIKYDPNILPEDVKMVSADLKVEVEDLMDHQDGSPEVGDVDRSSRQATKTAFQCLGYEYLTNDINQLLEHRHTEHGVAINDEGVVDMKEVDFENEIKTKAKEEKKMKKQNQRTSKSTRNSDMYSSCFLCGHISCDSNEFKDHKQTVHGWNYSTGHYPCQHCDRVFKSNKGLRIHHDAVHIGVKHPCNKCDKVFCAESGLRKHMRAVHTKQPYLCELCEYTCYRSTLLKHHVDSVHKGIRFYCDKCPFSCKDKGHLAKHVERQHTTQNVRPKDKLKRFHCDRCVYSTLYMTALKEHIAVKHDGKVREVFKCEQCECETFHPNSLLIHIQNVHEKVRYKCEECDVEFTLFKNFQTHMRKIKNKSDSRKYSCDICTKKFCFEIAVKKHKKKEHSEATEPCDECNKVFYSKQNLNRHKKVIHMLEQFSCNGCDKVFSYRQTLNDHMRIKHSIGEGHANENLV